MSGKRADYALLSGNSVVVFLEAKRLDEPLSNHRSQIVAYASELGIKFPALTNGNEWEVYDNSKLVPIEQRRILNPVYQRHSRSPMRPEVPAAVAAQLGSGPARSGQGANTFRDYTHLTYGRADHQYPTTCHATGTA